MADRDLLFGATEQQIRALVTQLKRGGAPGLKLELLADLVYAGLNASGFSEVQRVKLVVAAESVVQGIRISPLAASWPFEALSRRAGVQEDVVEVSVGSLTLRHLTLHILAIVVKPALHFRLRLIT